MRAGPQTEITPTRARLCLAGLGLALLLLPAACGTDAGIFGGALGQPTPARSSPGRSGDVLASVINVTPYDVSVVLSGILGDVVDTVESTIGPSDSTDVRFVCMDELVVGDPLEPSAAGVIVDPDGEPQEVAPFSIAAEESFNCGDVIEIIVSGNDAETFAVDIFAFTPP